MWLKKQLHLCSHDIPQHSFVDSKSYEVVESISMNFSSLTEHYFQVCIVVSIVCNFVDNVIIQPPFAFSNQHETIEIVNIYGHDSLIFVYK